MTGSNHFSIDKSSKSFAISFRKLGKSVSKGQAKVLVDAIESQIEGLKTQPRPPSSRPEPLPGKTSLPPLMEFRKIALILWKGASGAVRLMYVVDFDEQVVTPVLVYNHEQFSGRPATKDISRAIQESVEWEPL